MGSRQMDVAVIPPDTPIRLGSADKCYVQDRERMFALFAKEGPVSAPIVFEIARSAYWATGHLALRRRPVRQHH
jgi:hypothetical protein